MTQTRIAEIDISHAPEVAGHLSWAMYYADPTNHALGVAKHVAGRILGKAKAAASKTKTGRKAGAKLVRFRDFMKKKAA